MLDTSEISTRAELLIRPSFYKLILDKERERNNHSTNLTRFYAVLEIINNELCLITVAVKTDNEHDRSVIKPVVIRTVNGQLFVNDIEVIRSYSQYNYRVDWIQEKLSKKRKYSSWYYCTEYYNEIYHGWQECLWWNFFNLAKPLNLDFVKELPDCKYCAYDGSVPVIDYLIEYKKNPKIEMLSKLGLTEFIFKKSFMSLLEKDKNFVFYVRDNAYNIKGKDVPVVLKAYKTNQDILGLQYRANFMQSYRYCLKTESEPIEVFQAITPMIKRVADYIQKNIIHHQSYFDYLSACVYLKLDLTDTKNLIPHDFRYWHDLRIDQQSSIKDDISSEGMRKVAEKYGSLQLANGSYSAIIAKRKSELQNEGKVLNHCVGKLNYDMRIAREDCLIFFIRKSNEIDTPFVTVEYIPKTLKINQCYGYRDTIPSQDVRDFVNNEFLLHCNKEVNKIRAKEQREQQKDNGEDLALAV